MIFATFWEDLTHGVVYRPVQVALLYWYPWSINYHHVDLSGNLEPNLSISVSTCSICRGWFHSRETDLLTVRQWRTPWKQNIASIQIIKNENFWNLYLTNQNDDIQKFTEKESISIPEKLWWLLKRVLVESLRVELVVHMLDVVVQEFLLLFRRILHNPSCQLVLIVSLTYNKLITLYYKSIN